MRPQKIYLTNICNIEDIEEDEDIEDADNELENEEESLLIGDTLTPLEKLVKLSNSSLVLQRYTISS